MNRKILATVLGLMLVAAACPALPQGKGLPPATEEEKEALLTQERIGELSIGMSQAQVAKAVP